MFSQFQVQITFSESGVRGVVIWTELEGKNLMRWVRCMFLKGYMKARRYTKLWNYYIFTRWFWSSLSLFIHVTGLKCPQFVIIFGEIHKWLIFMFYNQITVWYEWSDELPKKPEFDLNFHILQAKRRLITAFW